MVIQRRYVKIFKIFENDPQGKAILYKAFADAGRTDEDSGAGRRSRTGRTDPEEV
mgnify:CR=1 FL=1